jgi:hypothetical protein
MKSAKITFISLLLLSLFIPLQFVHADMAPPPAPELGGLQPFKYQTTNVQMVYERVEMDIQPFTQFDGDYAYLENRVDVTAYFTLHNQGDSPESMQAVFPLESFSNCIWQNGRSNSYTHYEINENSFNVLVSGVNVPVQKVVTDHPYKNRIGDPNGCDQMTWAGFDITFPAQEDVVVKVQYGMESLMGDFMQNIEYILETGAGWAGPIQRGYVIVKFPYGATAENVLSESTAGYQFLYNEVFWSFENLEPTSSDNIQVSIISPGIWQKILSIKRNLRENPKLAEQWLDLAQIYFDIATWHWDNLRSDEYYQKIPSMYEAGIANNPDNAELYAKYAEFKMYQWSPRLFGEMTEDVAAPILSLVSKALALDPTNETAKMTLSNLMEVAPFVTFTPPPTIPPTATSLFTVTPSITPSVTMTPVSSELQQPIIVTVVHTKLVKAPTPTQKSLASVTSSPTETVIPDAKQNKVSASPMIFGALVIFIAGVGVGTFWSKKLRK